MCRNPDGFLHKVKCFRFFYRRNPSLPYACTATWRFSTILHLFYLSPARVGWKSADRKGSKIFELSLRLSRWCERSYGRVCLPCVRGGGTACRDRGAVGNSIFCYQTPPLCIGKADKILSDFSEKMIIRFFYRRKSPLPYAGTATSRVSTILHLFYLSTRRFG